MLTQSKLKPYFVSLALVLALVGLVFCESCALFGGGGEIQRAKGYRVTAPKNWKPQSSNGESDLAYRLHSGNVVTLTSSCNRDNTVGLEILTKHLLFGERNLVFEKRERITVDHQEGLFSAVTTTLEGRPFHLNIFVLPRKQCIFDFSQVSPNPISADDTAEFVSFVKSFSYGTN